MEDKYIINKCDCCNQETKVYDVGSHFICKKCFIEDQDKRLKDKNQKTLIT